MTAKKLSSLGAMVRQKRGDAKLRVTAKEIGIGTATLMRVENGHTPDLTTFGKICQWLQVDPGSFLGFKRDTEISDVTPVQVSAHLKAPQTMEPKTVGAMARMILLAVKSQQGSQELNHDENT
jgi:transcriptional regulator with XRE-family HTH domain